MRLELLDEEDLIRDKRHQQLRDGAELDFEKILGGIVAKEEGGRRLSIGLMTVGTVDSDNEIVDQASVMRCMPAFMNAGSPVLLDHDRATGVGRCVAYTGIKADGTPTMTPEECTAIQVTTEYGKGYTFPSLFYGPLQVDDVWERIRQKMLPAHSIAFRGYTARSVQEDTDGDAMRIFCKRVLEYSVLLIPAHQEATLAAQLMKSAGFGGCQHCREELAQKLNQWTRRFPIAQSQELLEHARALARTASPVADDSLLSLASGIREAARRIDHKE